MQSSIAATRSQCACGLVVEAPYDNIERGYGLYSLILLYTKSIEVHSPNILLATQQSFDCGEQQLQLAVAEARAEARADATCKVVQEVEKHNDRDTVTNKLTDRLTNVPIDTQTAPDSMQTAPQR